MRQLYAGVLLFVSFGLVLALVWARLGAADLALAEASIGAGLTGVLLFAALARQPLAGSEPRLSGRRRLAAVLVLLPLLIVLLPQSRRWPNRPRGCRCRSMRPWRRAASTIR